MYINIHIHIHIHIYIYIYMYIFEAEERHVIQTWSANKHTTFAMHKYIFIHSNICTQIFIYIYAYMCMYIYIYIHIHTYMHNARKEAHHSDMAHRQTHDICHVYLHIYISIHVYTYTYTCIYIHTCTTQKKGTLFRHGPQTHT